MTTGEFDPDIPVGETWGSQHADPFKPTDPFQPAERFGGGQMSTPSGFADPSIPVGEPGGFQPAARFSPEPIPTSAGEFDPATVSAGGDLSRERFGPEHAGLGIRLPARLLDLLLCVWIAFMIAPKFGQSNSTYENSYGEATADHAKEFIFELVNFWVASLVLGVVAFIYFTVFESALGWTPAKRLLGLSVHARRPASPKPNLKEAARRNTFLNLLWFPIPYLNILFFITTATRFAFSILNSSDGRGTHDKKANTEVMKGKPI